MNPRRVDRSQVEQLTDLPNIGEAMAADLLLLGYATPDQIDGASPWEMYRRLCEITGARHDPCVIDVFMSVTSFLDGEPPRPWWEFTRARKDALARGERGTG